MNNRMSTHHLMSDIGTMAMESYMSVMMVLIQGYTKI